MLVFHAPDMPARLERLRALGCELTRAPAQLEGAGSALLEGPGDIPLLLLEGAD